MDIWAFGRRDSPSINASIIAAAAAATAAISGTGMADAPASTAVDADNGGAAQTRDMAADEGVPQMHLPPQLARQEGGGVCTMHTRKIMGIKPP